VFAELVEQVDVVARRRARERRGAGAHLVDEYLVAQALGGADIVEVARPHHPQRGSDVRALRAAGRTVGTAQGVRHAGGRGDEFAHLNAPRDCRDRRERR
jgi:hypothetical protein